MTTRNIDEVLNVICKEDPRFDKNAYRFLSRALEYTVKQLNRQGLDASARHVSGQELLDGIRAFALEEYGPLALTVLTRWGVRSCQDFGDMVFQLVNYKLLGKTEQDKPEDFAGGYDFYTAFELPFKPAREPAVRALSRWQ